MPVRVFAVLLAGLVTHGGNARAHDPLVLDIQYAKGSVKGDAVMRAGGFGVVRVRQGSHLLLRWRSDEDMTVHLQGYDIEARVVAGGDTQMRVQAGVAGWFAMEKRNRRNPTLFYLEVRPGTAEDGPAHRLPDWSGPVPNAPVRNAPVSPSPP